jgi:hypothetical protein
LFEPTTPAADVMPIVERALQLLHGLNNEVSWRLVEPAR